MGIKGMMTAGALAIASVVGSTARAGAAQQCLCGSSANASICFASVDRAGKLSAKRKAGLAAAAPVAIDIVGSPQSGDQKCEPPYVMGQLAEKLAAPESWDSYLETGNACRFWRRLR